MLAAKLTYIFLVFSVESDQICGINQHKERLLTLLMSELYPASAQMGHVYLKYSAEPHLLQYKSLSHRYCWLRVLA